MHKRIGEILVEMGAVGPREVEAALAFQRGRAMRLGEALVTLGHTDEVSVARALAKQAGVPFVDLSKGRVPPNLLERVPASVAREYGVLPVADKGGRLVVAIDDPVKTFLADNLRFVLDREVSCAIAAPSALARAIEASYGEAGAAAKPARAEAGAAEEDEEGPVVRLVNRTVEEALEARASDIHVEPFADRLRIRFRVDGVLLEAAAHPTSLHAPLLSRLKLMASMDIAEKRKPQDGRIALRVAGRDLDIRASVLPSNHGETFVMRILEKETGLLPLAVLGFHADDEAWFRRVVARPNGLVLVTGPTGSGKTTTLYAALSTLNRPDVKILTVEDPVEYHLKGVNQVAVRPKIGLTFGRILRSMLRHAPNVLLVGEIRDLEAAETAIQAALTGHLVFSTLHTNDAPSAIPRLVDIGVAPFLVAASLQAVVAQRLVRVLCESCRAPFEAPSHLARGLGIPVEVVAGRTLYRARGCGECAGSGYRGRKGIFERLEVDGALREAIYRGEPLVRLRDRARGAGRYTTLYEDGVRKVLAGTTSVEELLRVVGGADIGEEEISVSEASHDFSS